MKTLNLSQISDIQKRLWFATKIDSGWPTYNQPMAFLVKGSLDSTALEKALDTLVEIHPELRMGFPEMEEGPSILRGANAEIKLIKKDFASLPKKVRLTHACSFLEDLIKAPLALDKPPLMQAALVALEEKEHILLFNWHHIIIDGFSIAVFLRQFSELYNDLLSGKQKLLESKEEEFFSFDETKEALDFWKKQLTGANFYLELPKTSLQLEEDQRKGEIVNAFLSRDLTDKLYKLAENQKTTLFRILMAGYAALLHRYTGQEDFLIGYPVNLRPEELKEHLGIYINQLPMRFQFNSQTSFQDVINQTVESRRSARPYQGCPYDQITKSLGSNVVHLRQPLFNVSFVLENYSIKDLDLKDVQCEEMFLHTGTAKFDLSLMAFEEEKGIRLCFEYPISLFSDDFIQKFADNFQVLLNELVSHPNESIGKIPLLTEKEQGQILEMGTGIKAAYPREKSVSQLFEEISQKDGASVALRFKEESMTYAELNAKANQLARHLQKLAVKKGDFIGLALERSVDLIIGMLGILKVGAVYVPIDESYPQERKLFMIEDAGFKILLTQKSFVDQFPQEKLSIVCLDTLGAELKDYDQENLSVKNAPEDLIYINYTSGSTGRPKGAEVCHRGVVRLVMNADWIIVTPDDRILQMANISFDATTYEVWGALLNGACLCIYPSGKLSAEELVKFIVDQQITTALFTARLFDLIVEEHVDMLHGMRQLYSGGDAMSVYHAKKAYHALPGCRIINAYGPTENSVITTAYLLQNVDQLGTSVPIGRPIANTDVYILDRNLKPVPMGMMGELVCGGDGVALGYHRRPELTAEKFVADSFSSNPEARLYRTGDLARFLPDGNIEFFGRMDTQVKIRGFRIELGEIEEVIRHHETIGNAVVLAREDVPGDKQLVAYFEFIKGRKVSSEALMAYVAEKLPDYMVPAFFIAMQRLPVTPNGKLDRKALPAPEIGKGEEGKKTVVLKTDTERKVATLWSEILHAENISRENHFFRLGGDSIHAMRVIMRLKKDFNLEGSVDILFNYPLLAEFAAQLDLQKEGNPQERIPKRQQENLIPLSLNQESLWILDKFHPLSPIYMIPYAFRMKGSVAPKLLQKSLEIMARRHEILRTRFIEENSKAVQCIEKKGGDYLIEVDYSREENGEQKGLDLIFEKAACGMDLTELPLLQVLIIKVDQETHLGLLRAHHIIFDGWSSEIFFKEWSAVYHDLLAGKSVEEPPLAIQYGDFAVWQHAHINSEEGCKQLEYWKKKLSSAPELLELPWDKPRPNQFTGKGGIVQLELSEDLSRSLIASAQNQGCTLFVLLMAAFNVLLHRHSGKEDIVVGTPFANRSRHELEPLIGFLVQMLVIRTDQSDNPSFSEFIEQVKKTTTEAYQNADISFEELVAELNPARNPSYNPLFQVGFALENVIQTTVHLEGVKTFEIPLESKIAKFDLNLFVREEGNRLNCCMEYCSDLFEEETVRRMLINFQTLLKNIIKNPDERVDNLTIVSPSELHQLLFEWNDTKRKYPRESSVPALFEKTVEEFRGKTAVRFQGMDMTYCELNARANQFARYLQKLGVRKGDFIGLALERSVDLIIGMLGILKVGAVYVPIDESYPQERKLFMIEDTGLKILLTQKSFADHFPQEKVSIVCLDTLGVELADYDCENLNVKIGPEDLVYINYTSGSTGKPKGVEVCHRGVVRLVKNTDWMVVSPDDRILQMANISFDATTYEVWGALLNGARLCIYPSGKLAVEQLGKFLVDQQITIAGFTARLFDLIVEECVDMLHGLRQFYSVGDAMSVYHGKKAYHALPDCRIINGYGPTENSVITTTYVLQNVDQLGASVPIGRPIANTDVYILDSYLKPVPIGMMGELFCGGDGVAFGYHGRPQMTAEKFVPDPFSRDPKACLYRTGDLARFLPDGNVEFFGRIDTQVKIRGFRIELGEIEEVLRYHEAIGNAVVLAREDVPGDKQLVAYFECVKGRKVSVEVLKAYVAEKLPDYMVPAFFIALQRIPMTPNGKLDRKALPSPADLLAVRGEDFEAPQTPVEMIIAEIWSSLLNIPQIGRQDNFFHSGGHSITAAQLASLASTTLNVTIPVNLIFEDSTLEKYAKRIDQLMMQGEGEEKKLITSGELFWVWRNREAILDSSIGPEDSQPPQRFQYENPKNVFITGVTGFVGAFLLRELLENSQAKVYCHVRAKTESEAMSRLQEVMEKYLIWQPKYASRIVAIVGDLEKELLGIDPERFDFLSSEIDSIFHVGAYVNHALPYHKLKLANVLGTQEGLRLACNGRLKPFHYVSTVSVLSMDPKEQKSISEDIDIAESKTLFNGYAQSKWVGEKLVLTARSRGIPASIYRLSRVSGDSELGSGPTGDFLWRVMQACIRLGMAPKIDLKEEVTPVDYVSKAIHVISTKPEWVNKQYHVLNPQSYYYSDVFNVLKHLGYHFEMTDFENWRHTMVKEAIRTGEKELRALMPIFSELDLSQIGASIPLAVDHVREALKGSKVQCPDVDDSLFRNYIDYYVRTGFLPPYLTKE